MMSMDHLFLSSAWIWPGVDVGLILAMASPGLLALPVWVWLEARDRRSVARVVRLLAARGDKPWTEVDIKMAWLVQPAGKRSVAGWRLLWALLRPGEPVPSVPPEAVE